MRSKSLSSFLNQESYPEQASKPMNQEQRNTKIQTPHTSDLSHILYLILAHTAQRNETFETNKA